MNISKHQERTPRALAPGGAIHFERLASGKVSDITCVARDGHVPEDCTLALFDRLKKRGLIRSQDGHPYRATKVGIVAVPSEQNQR